MSKLVEVNDESVSRVKSNALGLWGRGIYTEGG
jgi:hypothetical protein